MIFLSQSAVAIDLFLILEPQDTAVADFDFETIHAPTFASFSKLKFMLYLGERNSFGSLFNKIDRQA